jgi:hypothetical protein
MTKQKSRFKSHPAPKHTSAAYQEQVRLKTASEQHDYSFAGSIHGQERIQLTTALSNLVKSKSGSITKPDQPAASPSQLKGGLLSLRICLIGTRSSVISYKRRQLARDQTAASPAAVDPPLIGTHSSIVSDEIGH